MASDTQNVKLGVCSVSFDGIDLGYTKGGVEVTVTTETHKVEIDQFGKTPVNEYIMGRTVTVKVPLAETTLENLVKIMPGATLSVTGGAKATGTITVSVNPADGETIVVNGVTFTFQTGSAPLPTDVLIGADATETALNLATVLSASIDGAVAVAEYTPAAAVVTVLYGTYGTEGNSFTLATGTAATDVTMSGATLASGAAPTKKKVEVESGVGTDLLATAKKLVLHPVAAGVSKADDFTVLKTNTPGALNFAYMVDQERVYDVEFIGYPDAVTKKIFVVGDETAGLA